MDILNTQVALGSLSVRDGRQIDSQFTGKPAPKITKTGDDVASLSYTMRQVPKPNPPIVGFPECSLTSRDGATGTQTFTVNASSGGVALRPLVFDVNVIAPGAAATKVTGKATAGAEAPDDLIFTLGVAFNKPNVV